MGKARKEVSLSNAVAKVEKVALEFSQGEINDLKANLLRLSKAKVTVRIGRDESGKIQYGEVDDTSIQLAATVKALEFGVGKPRSSLEITDTTRPNQGDPANLSQLAKLLHQNPDVTSRVLGALKDGLKLAEAIPVEAVTSESSLSPPDTQSGALPSKP